MPQKTRKEKQIAELRRKLALQTQDTQASIPSYSVTLTNPLSENTFKSENSTEVLAVNTKYVIRDLKKTLLLTGFIIILEIVLYYVMEMRGI